MRTTNWGFQMTFLQIILLSALGAAAFKLLVKKDAGDTLILSIIFLPATINWLTNSNLSEFGGFGLNAKFHVEIQKSVIDSKIDIKSSKVNATIESDFLNRSKNPDKLRLDAFFEACEDIIILSSKNVPRDKAERAWYIVYTTYAIRSSVACGALNAVIAIDEDNRYIGSYNPDFFQESLSIWSISEGTSSIDHQILADKILQQTVFGSAIIYPDRRIRSGEGYWAATGENSTLIEAYEAMKGRNVEFVTIVDTEGLVSGLITEDAMREYIIDILIGRQDSD